MSEPAIATLLIVAFLALGFIVLAAGGSDHWGPR